MCVQSLFKNGLIVGIFGAVFTTIISILGWVAVPDIIANEAKKTTVLEDGNFIWDIWSNPPFPIYTDFYIFNCTNYKAVVENGSKPIVEEVGPYSYREYRLKNTTVELPNTDEIVHYRESRWYYYSKDTSGIGTSLDDIITTVNPVYMTLSTWLDRLDEGAGVDFLVKTIDDFLTEKNESVFMTVTADEFIFKGWPLDTYIELYLIVKDLLDNWPPPLPDLPPGLPVLPDLPDQIKDGFAIGLFTSRNDTDDGLFRVNRGTSDYNLFGNIEAWGRKVEKVSSYLSYWLGDKSYCNKIQGTDGTIFPYGFDLDEKMFVYQTDLCRSVYFLYSNDETFEDLPARRFLLPKSVLENRTNEPENECFCLDKTDEGRCPNTGAMFLGACYEHAPLIGSNPHFFNGDERYINGVVGLNPNASKHQSVIVLEERTNALLYAAKRVQLSFDIRKTRLSATQNLTTRVFVPMLWYEENVIIDEESKSEFEIFTTIEIILWVLFACGLVLTVVGVILIVISLQKDKKSRRVV